MKNLYRLMCAAACAAALLAGCGGSGKVYKPLRPTAIYTFGDGIVDDGQTGGKLYTVNTTDAVARPVYSLPQLIAASYGLTLKPQSAGGTAWGQGGSRIANLQLQVTNQGLAAGFAGYGKDDLIILSAGMEDLISETQDVLAGVEDISSAKLHIQSQVRAYGQTMQYLHDHGARHIYILPPYNLGISPWMTHLSATNTTAPSVYAELFDTFSAALALEAEAVNNKTQSLYLSPTFRTRMGVFAEAGNSQNNAGTSIVNAALCSTPADVNASLCTDATLVTAVAADQAKYLFADNRHPVPVALSLLASGSVSELHGRWGSP
jgi:lysophospholipase L1-like esterase